MYVYGSSMCANVCTYVCRRCVVCMHITWCMYTYVYRVCMSMFGAGPRMYEYAYHVCMCMSTYVYRVCMSISTQIVCVCLCMCAHDVCACMPYVCVYVCTHTDTCANIHGSRRIHTLGVMQTCTPHVAHVKGMCYDHVSV